MAFPGNRKFPGNFPSRAYGNILFPVPTQYRHWGLPYSWSRLRLGNIREFRTLQKLEVINLISAFVKNFLTGTNLLNLTVRLGKLRWDSRKTKIYFENDLAQSKLFLRFEEVVERSSCRTRKKFDSSTCHHLGTLYNDILVPAVSYSR